MRGDETVLEAPCSAGSGMVLKEGSGGRVWVFDTPRGPLRGALEGREPRLAQARLGLRRGGRADPEEPGRPARVRLARRVRALLRQRLHDPRHALRAPARAARQPRLHPPRQGARCARSTARRRSARRSTSTDARPPAAALPRRRPRRRGVAAPPRRAAPSRPDGPRDRPRSAARSRSCASSATSPRGRASTSGSTPAASASPSCCRASPSTTTPRAASSGASPRCCSSTGSPRADWDAAAFSKGRLEPERAARPHRGRGPRRPPPASAPAAAPAGAVALAAPDAEERGGVVLGALALPHRLRRGRVARGALEGRGRAEPLAAPPRSPTRLSLRLSDLGTAARPRREGARPAAGHARGRGRGVALPVAAAGRRPDRGRPAPRAEARGAQAAAGRAGAGPRTRAPGSRPAGSRTSASPQAARAQRRHERVEQERVRPVAAAARLADVVPARVLRDEHAVELVAAEEVDHRLDVASRGSAGETPSSSTHAPCCAAQERVARSFSFWAWTQTYASGETPSRFEDAEMISSAAAPVAGVDRRGSRPVSRWQSAPASTSLRSMSESGPASTPIFTKPGRMPVPSMPRRDSAVHRSASCRAVSA